MSKQKQYKRKRKTITIKAISERNTKHLARIDDFDEIETEMLKHMQIFFGIKSTLDMVRYSLNQVYIQNQDKIVARIEQLKKEKKI